MKHPTWKKAVGGWLYATMPDLPYDVEASWSWFQWTVDVTVQGRELRAADGTRVQGTGFLLSLAYRRAHHALRVALGMDDHEK